MYHVHTGVGLCAQSVMPAKHAKGFSMTSIGSAPHWDHAASPFHGVKYYGQGVARDYCP